MKHNIIIQNIYFYLIDLLVLKSLTDVFKYPTLTTDLFFSVFLSIIYLYII